MKKRLTAIALSVVLVLSMLSGSVFAAEGTHGSVKLSATKTTLNVGETTEITFTVDAKSEAVGSVDFDVEIPSGLEYVSHQILVQQSDFMFSSYTTSDNHFGCGVTIAGKTGSFEVLKVTLKAKSTGVGTNNVGVTGLSIGNLIGNGVLDFGTVDELAISTQNPVTGVTIDETLAVELNGKATPDYTISPANATNQGVSFTTNNAAVATVNATTGEVTGVKEGTATITITTADGNFTDTCVVTVKCSHTGKVEHPAGTSSCIQQADGKYYTCGNCNQMLAADGTTVITSVPKEPLAAHIPAEVVAPEYLKTAGDCQNKAVYYKSCSVCHAQLQETFDDQYGDHKMSTAYTQENDQHFHKCTVPGCTYTDTKVNCSGGTATCQKKAVCTTCGNPWGQLASHDHATTWTKDETGHWYACQTPNCTDKKDFAVHTPNISEATETQDKVCTVCLYMIQPKLGHLCKNHLTLVQANPAYCEVEGNIEYYVCDCNKWYKDASAAVEITDKESVKIEKLGHDYTEKIEDAAHFISDPTNCQEKTTYWYDCSRCDSNAKNDPQATDKVFGTVAGAHNIIMTEWGYKVAEGHAHKCEFCDEHDTLVDHTPGEAATETTPQVCTVCGYEIQAALGHSFGTEWKSDDDNHWNVCACGETGNKAAHVDANKDGKCDVCGHNVPLPPSDPAPVVGGDASQLFLWFALLLVSGFGVFAVYADKKRNK